jgi:hypothetical protein
MQEKKRDGDTYTRRPEVPTGRLPPLPPNSSGLRNGAKEEVNSSGRNRLIHGSSTVPQTQGETEKPGKPGEGSETQKGDRP